MVKEVTKRQHKKKILPQILVHGILKTGTHLTSIQKIHNAQCVRLSEPCQKKKRLSERFQPLA